MKQTVYLLISETHIKAAGYLSAICQSFLDCGMRVCAWSSPDALAIDMPGVRSGRGTASELINDLKVFAPDTEELIILTDAFAAPALPLQDFCERLAHVDAPCWYLTRGAAMAGFRNGLWTSRRLSVWLSGRAFAETLADTAEAMGGTELYDTSALAFLTDQPLIDEPVTMLRNLGCPFWQHKVFHRDYSNVIDTTLGHMGQELYAYLTETLHQDMGDMWDYLLSAYHQDTLFRAMHLQYTVSVSCPPAREEEEQRVQRRVALAMHLYYTDLIQTSVSYALRFPPETDVFITTSDEDKRRIIRKAFAGKPFHSVQIRVIGNRGRDVSALLVGMRDLAAWDYICFYHDKKVLQTKPGTVGMGFAYVCAENLFATDTYVRNVIALMEKHPRLGILTPPPPNHADYFFTMAKNWGPNWQQTREMYNRLHLSVPMAETHMPVAPLGTCFWFRGAALRSLLAHPWKYEDFPPEPNGVDGTMLHAIERIYPFVAQEAGFYSAYLYSDRFAALQYNSFRHYVRGFQQVLVRHGVMNKHRRMLQDAAARLR